MLFFMFIFDILHFEVNFVFLFLFIYPLLIDYKVIIFVLCAIFAILSNTFSFNFVCKKSFLNKLKHFKTFIIHASNLKYFETMKSQIEHFTAVIESNIEQTIDIRRTKYKENIFFINCFSI
jgi:hypothetical protein